MPDAESAAEKTEIIRISHDMAPIHTDQEIDCTLEFIGAPSVAQSF